MGTPHRGSSLALWGKMLASIVNAVPLAPVVRHDLLKVLETTSKELEEISIQSVHRLSGLKIASVVECRPMAGDKLVLIPKIYMKIRWLTSTRLSKGGLQC
jgi:hypothetical protein